MRTRNNFVYLLCNALCVLDVDVNRITVTSYIPCTIYLHASHGFSCPAHGWDMES